MYKVNRLPKTQLKGVPKYVGERLETKVKRIESSEESISDGAPPIYTDKAEGVIPAYDIRTDRWEIATDTMDKIHRDNTAKREGKVVDMQGNEVDGGSSEQGENSKNGSE